jgi:hypothetical protein
MAWFRALDLVKKNGTHVDVVMLPAVNNDLLDSVGIALGRAVVSSERPGNHGGLYELRPGTHDSDNFMHGI